MKICFIVGENGRATEASLQLKKKYGHYDFSKADVVVVLGGDGLVLRAIHQIIDKNIPIFSMNMGNLGFLTNKYSEEDLISRISNSVKIQKNPISMLCSLYDGTIQKDIAVNEIYLFRASHQAAKLKINIDNMNVMECLCSDGVIISTQIGSTAYNYSANGLILPLDSKLYQITPISPFRPRHWNGALINEDSIVYVEILENIKRPVNLVCDFIEYKNIKSCTISKDVTRSFTLLFDKDNDLNKKFLMEQFN